MCVRLAAAGHHGAPAADSEVHIWDSWVVTAVRLKLQTSAKSSVPQLSGSCAMPELLSLGSCKKPGGRTVAASLGSTASLTLTCSTQLLLLQQVGYDGSVASVQIRGPQSSWVNLNKWQRDCKKQMIFAHSEGLHLHLTGPDTACHAAASGLRRLSRIGANQGAPEQLGEPEQPGRRSVGDAQRSGAPPGCAGAGQQRC